MPAKPSPLPDTETRLLAELGERLRLARLRRKLTAQQVAERAGITRVTLHRAESGEPAVTMGTYVHVLRMLGMGADLALLARDDAAGRQLQDAQLPRRRRAGAGRGAPKSIRIARYPQLKQLAWHLAPDATLSPEEALELYERNWRHIDHDAMPPAERQLVQRLTDTVGKGVLLV